MKAKITKIEIGIGEDFYFKLFIQTKAGDFELVSKNRDFYKELFYQLNLKSVNDFVGKTLNIEGV